MTKELPVGAKRLIYQDTGDLELTVDVFGLQADAKKPGIVLFHGGGWVFEAPSQFHGICAWFARRGWVAIAVEYRLSRQADGSYPHPEITPVESTRDARTAVRWIRAQANELGIDPERIVVGGQSAGGQLAMATAIMEHLDEPEEAPLPAPAAIWLIASNVNTVEAWLDHLMGEKRGQIWSISPYHNLRAGMPPVIAFHGEKDTTVPHYAVELFEARMRELGNRYELRWIPDREHRLGPDSPEFAHYCDEAILEETMRLLNTLGIAL